MPFDPNKQHTNPSDELLGEYEVECTACKTRRAFEEYTSAGWAVGDMMGKDPANPSYGRCHKCSSYSLRVIRTPIYQSATGVPGFTKIPQA